MRVKTVQSVSNWFRMVHRIIMDDMVQNRLKLCSSLIPSVIVPVKKDGGIFFLHGA